MIEYLKKTAYPGRFIALGKDGGASVVIYGATGRSPSSLARKFVPLEDGVYMTAHDATVLIHGNPELLEYPAVRFFDNGVMVANGQHIERIETLQNREAKKQLSYALADEAYEPDEHRTPRITGCVIETNSGVQAALHIIRSVADGIDRSSWNIELTEGRGRFISTYAGNDVKPTPSFSGEPKEVSLVFGSADKAARNVFEALSPRAGTTDYRVGVVAVYKQPGEDPIMKVINRITE